MREHIVIWTCDRCGRTYRQASIVSAGLQPEAPPAQGWQVVEANGRILLCEPCAGDLHDFFKSINTVAAPVEKP